MLISLNIAESSAGCWNACTGRLQYGDDCPSSGRERHMDLWLLKPGHKIRTRDGAEAKVLSETEDGEWIRVRYLDGGNDPLFAGTEDLAHREEIQALLGVAHKSTWGEKVTVVLHHVPEGEESEEGYEAVTMKGVPHGVIITGSASDSAEAALNRLLDGLRAFGFSGRVAVEDVTSSGRVERYEIDTLE